MAGASAPVTMSESLRLGLSDDFVDYFRQYGDQDLEIVNRVCKTVKTDLRKVSNSFKESIPFPKLWPKGTPRHHASFRDRNIEYFHRNYSLAIDYDRWDQDDETIKGDLQTHLQGMAGRFSELVLQLFVDGIQGVQTLGQPATLCYDGAALTAAQDGDGNARMGVTGGNKVTSAKLADESDLITALINARKRFRQMKDTADRPFWKGTPIDFRNMLLLAAPKHEGMIDRAMKATATVVDRSVAHPTENIYVNTFDKWISPLITNESSIYVVLENPYYKPLAIVDRAMTPEIIWAQMGSGKSDEANETGIETAYGHIRVGEGKFSPHCIIELQV